MAREDWSSMVTSVSYSMSALPTMSRQNQRSAVSQDQRSADDLRDLKCTLAVLEQRAPESAEVAATLYALGLAATRGDDLAAAEDFLRRALVIQERVVPNTREIAQTLNDLGIVANRRDDLAAAEDFPRRASQRMKPCARRNSR
jgi:hypothetical protein